MKNKLLKNIEIEIERNVQGFFVVSSNGEVQRYWYHLN